MPVRSPWATGPTSSSVGFHSVRTAGAASDLAAETAVFAATADDITDVYVDGRRIVADGVHATIDVVAELAASIEELMDDD